MSQEAKFSIREATIGDGRAILACLREAFAGYRGSYTPGAFADTVLTEQTLARRLATMRLFVATTETGEIFGTVACSVSGPREGHIRGMAVGPAWQHKGNARLLLARVESELLRRKCTRISLGATAPLEQAMLFYEKHGVRRSGRVTDFFGMELFEYVKVLLD